MSTLTHPCKAEFANRTIDLFGRCMSPPAKPFRPAFWDQCVIRQQNENSGLAVVLASCGTALSEPTPSTSVLPPRSEDFVSTFGTPFVLAFKLPACGATALASGPIAGASALVENDGGRETRHEIRETLRRLCGPPYVLTP
jgi:hypothetical protein